MGATLPEKGDQSTGGEETQVVTFFPSPAVLTNVEPGAGR